MALATMIQVLLPQRFTYLDLLFRYAVQQVLSLRSACAGGEQTLRYQLMHQELD